MLTLGIDPSSTQTYGALYDGERIVAAGRLAPPDERGQYGICEGKTGLHWRDVHELAAAVVETVEPAGGIYSRDGKAVRSRAAAVLETDRAGWRIAEQLRRAGVRVWTPTRHEILRQGLGRYAHRKRDDAVTCELAGRGLLTKRVGNAGQYLITQPAYLRNVNARDAAMAALFGWQSPLNAQYEYQPTPLGNVIAAV